MQGEDVRADRQVIEHDYLGCCWPDRGPRARFWGAALLLVGGVWLAGNLFGLKDWGRWLVPALLVAWGMGLLLDKGADALGPKPRR